MDKDFFPPQHHQSPMEVLLGADVVYKLSHPGCKRMNDLILFPFNSGMISLLVYRLPRQGKKHKESQY